MATVRPGEKTTLENWQAKYGEVEQWDEQCWQEQQWQETQWQETQWQETQQWPETQWQEHSEPGSSDGSHIHHQGK
jgi:hypothetical protein